MAKKRVDSRDVLDPNARIRAPFHGRVVGHFRPTGPNAWDDFEYVEEEGGSIEVLAGVKVQVEPPQPRVRLRRRGRVHVVEWRPQAAEEAEREASGLEPFAYFTSRYLADYSSPPGMGLAALLHRKLKSDDREGD